MKKQVHALFGSLLVLAMLFSFTACAKEQVQETPSANPEDVSETTPEAKIENSVIRLSTTTSVNDSGLLPYLQPEFEADTGYKLEVTSAGTGAAIEKGRTGDADALLVHAKASEETFIEEGFAKERIPFMYNFFVMYYVSMVNCGYIH